MYCTMYEVNKVDYYYYACTTIYKMSEIDGGDKYLE